MTTDFGTCSRCHDGPHHRCTNSQCDCCGGGLAGMARRRGVSTTQLAEIAGVSRATAYRRMAGQSSWRLDELRNIATTWNIDVDELL